MPLELAQDGAQLSRAALIETAHLLGGAGRQDELLAVEAIAQLGHAGIARAGTGVRALDVAAVLAILQGRLLANHPRQADRPRQRIDVPVVHADVAVVEVAQDAHEDLVGLRTEDVGRAWSRGLEKEVPSALGLRFANEAPLPHPTAGQRLE